MKMMPAAMKTFICRKFTLTTGAEWGMIVMLVKQIDFT